MATIAEPHMQSLAKADVIRKARSELKWEVRAGSRTAASVILNPPECALSMTVVELLACQKQWARTRSAAFCRRLAVSEFVTVGRLTDRQRGVIEGRLR